VHDEVGEHGLLERRLEGLDQLVGELLDEPDRVGDEITAPPVLERPSGRIEVWKSLSPTPTPAPVSELRSVDLPALV
jgi:hypothetical protein